MVFEVIYSNKGANFVCQQCKYQRLSVQKNAYLRFRSSMGLDLYYMQCTVLNTCFISKLLIKTEDSPNIDCSFREYHPAYVGFRLPSLFTQNQLTFLVAYLLLLERYPSRCLFSAIYRFKIYTTNVTRYKIYTTIHIKNRSRCIAFYGKPKTSNSQAAQSIAAQFHSHQ